MKLMGSLRRLWRLIREHALVAVGVVLGAGLLLYKLGSLPAASLASQTESITFISSERVRVVLEYAFYLPLTAVDYLFVKFLPLHNLTSLRLGSVLFAGLALACMLYVIRRWYGQRILFFALFILITSAAVLHIGRAGSTHVLYLAAMPLLLASHIALDNSPLKKRVFIGWLATLIGLLYVPGLIWLVIVQMIWQREVAREAIASFKILWQQILLGIGVLIGLAPLAFGFYKNFNLDYLLTWLGLPTAVPDWLVLGKDAAASVLFIFARTPEDPALWLGTLPLLSAFLLVCFVAGIAFYMSHVKAERTQLLLTLSGVGLLLVCADGPVPRTILIPLIYLVAIGGLAYIMHYWLKLFPLNAIARRLGLTLVALAVVLSCTLSLRHYFVAWPNNRETKAVFIVPIPE